MAKKQNKQVPIRPARGIPAATRLFLYVHAGGRCEFDGCNEYLLEHYPTETVGNFAEQAHAYAFNKGGPRGKEAGRPDDINCLANLMLLCKDCHHLVDTNPENYPVAVLKKFKRDHEDRVYSLTDLSKDRDTVPLVLNGLVNGRPVDVSDEEMQTAVVPNYLKRRDKLEIDLTHIPDVPDEAFWKSSVRAVDGVVARLYDVPLRPGRTLRVSVFAIAPIPLLIHLGARLSDKMEVYLFQRHRNPETWEWASGPATAEYGVRTLSTGTDPKSVALLVNLSGRNTRDLLPEGIGPSFTVYELSLTSDEPNPLFLRCRDDLARFHDTWVRTMASIRHAHAKLDVIHLFPAVPAPTAILLGRSRLPKIDPSLLVYDRDRRAGGFVPTLEVTTEWTPTST